MNFIEEIASNPDLDTDDLSVVLDVTDGIEFDDTSQLSQLN